MNVCCVCEADGVLEALGSWYCVDHAGVGLVDVACFVARLYDWDVAETEETISEWVFS